jgi:phenylalanyl-tRNA synthetase alpha chain
MKEIIKGLHPLERKIIPFLKKTITLKELVQTSKLKEIEAMRAMQWLENKKIVEVKTEVTETVQLDSLGQKYLNNKLPERRLLEQVAKKAITLQEAQLDKGELNIAIGALKKKQAITLGKQIEITAKGKEYLKKEFEEEKFLKQLPIEVQKIKDIKLFNNIKKRKQLIQIETTKIRTISLTHTGIELQKQDLKVDFLESLTHKMLKEGTWKNKEFRKYDIKVNVPKIYSGKRQPYMQFLSKIKFELVKLGFEEMTGPLIETEFYNFDVLFQPQNHPARTWTDTYHLKNPTHGDLPDSLAVNKIKNAHEYGGETKSKGWQYKWDPEVAKLLMPRAHTTALSARWMAKGIESPCKYFAIGRVFRPDVLDATHLIEFNMLEGFVADKSINFRTLLGMLKQFAIEIAGATEVRFYPDYYPFTEPSVQMSAKHPELGWVELGGAGIFRPEITESLGIDVPVMAWGLGIDRLAMFKLGIKDIRYLFAQDLKWLREPRII